MPPRLVTSADFLLSEMVPKLREVFASVFGRHYAATMIDARNNLTSPNTQKREKAEATLDGFSDLIQKRFNGSIEGLREEAIFEVLYKLYFGPGIDDEVAFLRAWANQNNNFGPEEHYNNIKNELPPDDQTEIDDYLKTLNNDNRKLLKVDFVALVDEQNRVQGFVIYHLFQKGNQKILHVRQGAMRSQGRGEAHLIGKFLIDKYPDFIYEANKRNANDVPAKERFISLGLLHTTKASLGYSDKYTGLESTTPIMRMYIDMINKKQAKKEEAAYFNIHKIKPENSKPVVTKKISYETEMIPEKGISEVAMNLATVTDDICLHAYYRPGIFSRLGIGSPT